MNKSTPTQVISEVNSFSGKGNWHNKNKWSLKRVPIWSDNVVIEKDAYVTIGTSKWVCSILIFLNKITFGLVKPLTKHIHYSKIIIKGNVYINCNLELHPTLCYGVPETIYMSGKMSTFTIK
jgi:hypothetical protein